MYQSWLAVARTVEINPLGEERATGTPARPFTVTRVNLNSIAVKHVFVAADRNLIVFFVCSNAPIGLMFLLELCDCIWKSFRVMVLVAGFFDYVYETID